MKRTLAFLLLPFFLISSVEGKSFDTYGVVPFISLSKSFATKFDLNFYHSDTFALTQRSFEGKTYKARDQQTYFQTSLGYKFLPELNFSLGHIFQRNNPLDSDFSNENRIFEQAVFSHKRDEVQFTHRIRFEERFIDEKEKSEFKTRLRYQIGINFPLQGRQLDPGEWYFNSYNEFYFSTTGERNALYSDDWLYVGAGYQSKEWGRFEIGPLSQFSVVNEEKDIKTFYALQTGWIYKF